MENNRIEDKIDDLLLMVSQIQVEVATGKVDVGTLRKELESVKAELKQLREDVLPARKMAFIFSVLLKIGGGILFVIVSIMTIIRYFLGVHI